MPNPPMESIAWRRVSGAYLVTEIVSGACWTLVFGAATIILVALGLPWYAWIWPAIMTAIALIGLVMAYFRARAIGYALREDDFLVRRGVLFRRTVAVPYGRMQVVDVNQGPLERMLGLASVKMVTAAAGTHALLPGLKRADADELRDHLVRVAETRRAGL